LTLSSMVTRDVWAPLWARFGRTAAQRGLGVRPSAWVGRAFVLVLALVGLAIAYRPPGTFVEITTETFTGLAVLFPTVVAALYWRRFDGRAAVASIGVGEALVVAYHLKWLPTLGTLPVVPVVLGTTVVLAVGSLFLKSRREVVPVVLAPALSRRAKLGWAALFLALFAAANDVWAWGDGRSWLLGLPWWVWTSAALCALLSIAFWLFGRKLSAGTEE